MRLNPFDGHPPVPDFDFHTHRLDAPPGQALVSLPAECLLQPDRFRPAEGGLYSAGIHPWWTADAALTGRLLTLLPQWVQRSEVVAIGECGLDRLQGADIPSQEALFRRQVALAEDYRLPVVVHCVRSFDILLRLRKEWRPTTPWLIHGFRGGAPLAFQLLQTGCLLGFGTRFRPESVRVCPPERCFAETDEGDTPISDIRRALAAARQP